jgi:hypothetical protein
MIVYTKPTYKHRGKQRKPKGPVAKKLDLKSLRGVDVVFGSNRALRPGSDVALSLQSHVTSTQFSPARMNVMDPAQLAKESPEVRAAIIAKSKRLAPAYNKSGIQYISDETDLQTLGKKV